MKIEIKQLKKDIPFQSQTISVLKEVSMVFEAGQIVTIVGESGSGKSTLLNILSLLDNCIFGEYYWDDKNIFSLSRHMKQELLAKDIGIVFQQYNLISNMTCCENVKLPLYLNESVKRSDRKKLADDMLKRVGLSQRKERVAIARALINNPKVIFADEPTGNVDSENERQILQLFREVANQGKIVVIATHSEVVKSFSDKVYRILDGVVMEEGI